MRLINLTPHDVVIITDKGKEIKIPPSGFIARITTRQEVTEYLSIDDPEEIVEIPVVKTEFSEIHGVPLACENCKRYDECEWYKEKMICHVQKPEEYYIVSTLVAIALSGRKDILAPDTSPNGVVRDKYGNIKGVKRFQRW